MRAGHASRHPDSRPNPIHWIEARRSVPTIGSAAEHTLPDMTLRARPASGRTIMADQDEILASALVHAETQLLAQIADETSLDGRLMGVLGFNGALIAADIAAQPLLHFWWWTPLPFLAVASFRCFRSIFSKETLLGPSALAFYADYGGQTARLAREQLLADLDDNRKKNAERSADKAKVLKSALLILFVGLFIAGALIVFATPTKVGSHVCKRSAKTCPAATRPGSSPVGTSAGGYAWRPWVAPPRLH